MRMAEVSVWARMDPCHRRVMTVVFWMTVLVLGFATPSSSECSKDLESTLKSFNCTCDEDSQTGSFARCIDTDLLTVPVGLPDTTTFHGLHLEGNSFDCLEKIPYPSIQNVILSNNQIKCIPEGIFSNLGNVETMVLANNSFHLESPNTFSGMTSLKTLTLDNNPLYELVNMTFSGDTTPALEHLSLAYCRIYEVQSLAFHNMAQLNVLNLSHNRLSHPVQINNAAALYTLDLSFNQIGDLSDLPFDGLKKVVSLHLDHNRLTTLDSSVFQGLDNLRQVTLSFNQLADVSPTTFVNLLHLETIRLDHNELKTLKIDSTQLNTLEGLKIHHNRWVCDCDVSWMRDNAMIRKFNPADQMRCNGPGRVSGQTLYEVDIHQFDCDSQHHGLHGNVVALAMGIIVSILGVVAITFLLYKFVIKKKPTGTTGNYNKVGFSHSAENLDNVI